MEQERQDHLDEKTDNFDEEMARSLRRMKAAGLVGVKARQAAALDAAIRLTMSRSE